jgi:hypothetical protein
VAADGTVDRVDDVGPDGARKLTQEEETRGDGEDDDQAEERPWRGQPFGIGLVVEPARGDDEGPERRGDGKPAGEMERDRGDLDDADVSGERKEVSGGVAGELYPGPRDSSGRRRDESEALRAGSRT